MDRVHRLRQPLRHGRPGLPADQGGGGAGRRGDRGRDPAAAAGTVEPSSSRPATPSFASFSSAFMSGPGSTSVARAGGWSTATSSPSRSRPRSGPCRSSCRSRIASCSGASRSGWTSASRLQLEESSAAPHRRVAHNRAIRQILHHRARREPSLASSRGSPASISASIRGSVAGVCFVTALAIWWIYFDLADTSVVGRGTLGFVYTYGHFLLFPGSPHSRRARSSPSPARRPRPQPAPAGRSPAESRHSCFLFRSSTSAPSGPLPGIAPSSAAWPPRRLVTLAAAGGAIAPGLRPPPRPRCSLSCCSRRSPSRPERLRSSSRRSRPPIRPADRRGP